MKVNPYSVEKESHSVKIDADPTGDVPRYAFLVSATDTDPTADWANGEWSGSWSSTTKEVLALTPTVGSSAATVELTEGANYDVWIEITVSGQVIVERFDYVECAV